MAIRQERRPTIVFCHTTSLVSTFHTLRLFDISHTESSSFDISHTVFFQDSVSMVCTPIFDSLHTKFRWFTHRVVSIRLVNQMLRAEYPQRNTLFNTLLTHRELKFVVDNSASKTISDLIFSQSKLNGLTPIKCLVFTYPPLRSAHASHASNCVEPRWLNNLFLSIR